VTNRGRFRAIGSDAVAARLVASIDRLQLLLADAAGQGILLASGITDQPLAQVAAPDTRAVILATDRALYRLDIDRALSRIDAYGVASISALKGPFAQAEAPLQPAQQEPPVPIVEPPSQAPVSSKPAAPPVAPPAPDDTVPLTLSNAEWREVQSGLRARGLYSGAVDGIAGPLTLAGLRAWQVQTGRLETGVLTERQRVELILGVR
jgi:peptidoglycan hydrolase-like protein with peptidoglycan-binding domain